MEEQKLSLINGADEKNGASTLDVASYRGQQSLIILSCNWVPVHELKSFENV
jgi:hypothetical protein